jgi:capsule polysaccharide export protein KpsE/RkpR
MKYKETKYLSQTTSNWTKEKIVPIFWFRKYVQCCLFYVSLACQSIFISCTSIIVVKKKTKTDQCIFFKPGFEQYVLVLFFILFMCNFVFNFTHSHIYVSVWILQNVYIARKQKLKICKNNTIGEVRKTTWIKFVIVEKNTCNNCMDNVKE